MIGGGEDLARLSRIPVDRHKTLVFVLSGALAGLAGVMESARIGLGHVDIGLGQMFAAITAVVIGGTPLSGGRGGVLQSMIGVLILVVLANGMIFVGISPYIQKSVLRSVAEANDAGIGMVFQEQSLLPNISVAENIMLGCEGEALSLGFYRWSKLYQLAAAQLEKLASEISPSAHIDSLSCAERQVVEFAKVLGTRNAAVRSRSSSSTNRPRCWKLRRSTSSSRW